VRMERNMVGGQDKEGDWRSYKQVIPSGLARKARLVALTKAQVGIHCS